MLVATALLDLHFWVASTESLTIPAGLSAFLLNSPRRCYPSALALVTPCVIVATT